MKIVNRNTHAAAYEAMRAGKPIELFGSRFVVARVSWDHNLQQGSIEMVEVRALTSADDDRTIEGDVTIRAEGVVLPHHLQVTFNKD